MLKAGYSIVEMVVVMAIVAVLMLLGATALISARNQNIARDNAEQLIADLRRTQTKALSTEGDCSAVGGIEKPKIWMLEVDQTNNVESYYLCKKSGGGYVWQEPALERRDYPTDSITINADGDNPSSYFFIYNTPFGKFYHTDTKPDADTGISEEEDNSEGFKPTISSSSETPITITYSYGGYSFIASIDPKTGIAELK